MIKISRLIKLHGEDLLYGNLEDLQKWLWQQFEGKYDGTLIIVRTNFGKEFAFYIPYEFKKTNH